MDAFIKIRVDNTKKKYTRKEIVDIAIDAIARAFNEHGFDYYDVGCSPDWITNSKKN